MRNSSVLTLKDECILGNLYFVLSCWCYLYDWFSIKCPNRLVLAWSWCTGPVFPVLLPVNSLVRSLCLYWGQFFFFNYEFTVTEYDFVLLDLSGTVNTMPLCFSRYSNRLEFAYWSIKENPLKWLNFNGLWEITESIVVSPVTENQFLWHYLSISYIFITMLVPWIRFSQLCTVRHQFVSWVRFLNAKLMKYFISNRI